MSFRHDVADAIKAAWLGIPTLAEVRVIATAKELDRVTVPTALIRQRTIARMPEAPHSHRNVGLLLTLISPLTDFDAAADQLDVLVPAALDHLDRFVRHDDATEVAYGNLLAYDIPLTALATKE